tara:strand:+ start:81 stop:458 length:378 start_codon:yes stop_codon:yes gene_type:complete
MTLGLNLYTGESVPVMHLGNVGFEIAVIASSSSDDELISEAPSGFVYIMIKNMKTVASAEIQGKTKDADELGVDNLSKNGTFRPTSAAVDLTLKALDVVYGRFEKVRLKKPGAFDSRLLLVLAPE